MVQHKNKYYPQVEFDINLRIKLCQQHNLIDECLIEHDFSEREVSPLINEFYESTRNPITHRIKYQGDYRTMSSIHLDYFKKNKAVAVSIVNLNASQIKKFLEPILHDNLADERRMFLKLFEDMECIKYQELRMLRYKTNFIEPYEFSQNVSEEAKLILYNSERYEQIREESIIATNQRFLAVRKIERWWINNNWNPKYKRCRERLDREYQELFPAE